MPAVRTARRRFTQAQRNVATHEKAARLHNIELNVASSRDEAATARGRLKAVTAMLKQARRNLKDVSADLRRILLVEAAKSRALAQARALALYKAKLQTRLGNDLDKAVAKFTQAWKKKRNKIVSRKLAAKVRKEAAKAKAASRKANTKAKESVKRAESLAKAKARKATVKAKAKAKKLAAKVKKKSGPAVQGRNGVGQVVRKTAGKAGLGAVGTRKVARKKRSK